MLWATIIVEGRDRTVTTSKMKLCNSRFIPRRVIIDYLLSEESKKRLWTRLNTDFGGEGFVLSDFDYTRIDKKSLLVVCYLFSLEDCSKYKIMFIID